MIDDIKNGNVLISAPAKVYKVTIKSKTLIDKDCSIQIINSQPFSFIFVIFDSNSQILLEANIASVITVQYSINSLTLYFNIRYQNKLNNFNLVFPKENYINCFVNFFVKSLFEQEKQRPATSADWPQIDQVMSSMLIDNLNEHYEDDDELFDDEEQSQPITSTDGGHNFLLRIAPRADSTMVLRKYNDHCDIGLFSNDNNCQYRMRIADVSDEKGEKLSVSDMLTNNSDHSLLLLDQSRPHEIFELNMDRSFVTNHYNAIDSSNIKHPVSRIFHRYQNDPTQPVFLGFNNKNTMLFDTRVPKSIVNRSDYKGDNKFTCGITTKSGRIAMGSADGTIRLYNEPCKSRATVNLHANVGEEPIISLDVSPEEEWIVATCPNYISCFNVRSQTTQKLAFDLPLKGEKPLIIKLIVSQNDQQMIAQSNGGELLSFSNAKFEIKNGKAVSIVASIGNALVSWNFNQIMKNRIPKYSITYIKGENIVDSYPLTSSDILYMSPNQLSVAMRQKKPK